MFLVELIIQKENDTNSKMLTVTSCVIKGMYFNSSTWEA